MDNHKSSSEKRRHPRFFLGLSVRLHLAGEPGPTNIELADLSAGGGYFRSSTLRPWVEQRAAFGFVVGERDVCAAVGRVVRIDANGFALALDAANSAFRDFIGGMPGPHLHAA